MSILKKWVPSLEITENMKRKILFLGSTKGTKQMIRYAQSIGMHTIVTDVNPVESSEPKQVADEYWMVSTGDTDAVEKKCREEGISAIACGVTEFNLYQQMELCKRLGLPSYLTPEAWHYSVDKADFKALCRKVGAPVPKDFFVSEDPTDEEIDAIEFPVMVKPVDRAGNTGISYCYKKEDFRKAVEIAKASSRNPKMVIEHMIHGEEWFASYMLADGVPSLIALNAMYSQPGEPKNCYTVTTTVSDHINQFLTEINPKIEEVLKEVGCREGYAWVQVMRDTDEKFYIIEMGYRLDGDMIYIPYKETCGFDAVKFLVDYACGVKHTPKDLPKPQSGAYTKCGVAIMLWTNNEGEIKNIEGVEEIAKKPGVEIDGMAKVGDKVSKYHSIGNILFTSENEEEMCRMIQKLNDTIKITNEKDENLIIRFDDFDMLRRVYKAGIEEGIHQ
jgi:ATP-grasp domain protein